MSDVFSVGMPTPQQVPQSPADVADVKQSPADVKIEYVGEGRVNYGDENMSVMEAVSMLFMHRSEVFSSLAANKINKSQNNLKQIKEAREMLSRMRTRQSNAGNDSAYMPIDVTTWMTQNHIDKSGGTYKGDSPDKFYTKDEWGVMAQNTETYIESLTDSNQMDFLKLKSTINKLDEATSASNKMFDRNYDAIRAILSRS